MDRRYFPNPYTDYQGESIVCPSEKIEELIDKYVSLILKNTLRSGEDTRGDLYVGNAGIAYMFLRLHQSAQKNQSYLQHAVTYINHAKANARQYSKRRDERAAFLCGNAGIYAVSAVISHELKDADLVKNDLVNFENGFEPSMHNDWDEILVGRAGYLSGMYWLNEQLKPKPFDDGKIIDLCAKIVSNGRDYSKSRHSSIPLLYSYHGTEYLGAAHGLCSILHMLLQSPWFSSQTQAGNLAPSKHDLSDIRSSIDHFLALQDDDGNFPVSYESKREKRLVHWCHGAPGAVYLLAKAYLVYKEEQFLTAAQQAAELIWQKGLLFKGPGICHGVAGNGYAFLLLYRLTGDEKYLDRAHKFMDFLTDKNFLQYANTPDRPYSLYEGLAGTVCFLVDLLNPNESSFPFMNVF